MSPTVEQRTRKAPKPTVRSRPIEHHIYTVHGQKVMLDSDLAALYGVTTGNLNLAVRRNKTRFPTDFMFELTKYEADSLLLQIARAKTGRGGRRTPFAFTELGVAMLSSVLNGERAVQMNMAIMRAFVRMRELIAGNKDIAARVEKLERSHDRTASVTAVPPSTKRKVSFFIDED